MKSDPILAVEFFGLIKPLLNSYQYSKRLFSSGVLLKILKSDPILAVEGFGLI
jgi:hypothetical protein